MVAKDNTLLRQHMMIQISEKENQLKRLDVVLDNLQSVEMKKIIHQKAILTKELEALKKDFDKMIVETKAEKTK